MRHLLVAFAGFLIIPSVLFADAIMDGPRLEKIAQGDEDQIDLTSVSLSISKHVDPELDIPHYEEYISKIVMEIKRQIQNENDPRSKIRRLASTIHDRYGFKIPDDRSHLTDPTYGMIDIVLKGKTGNCLGLVCLYLMIADQLNLPIKAQIVHSHIFLVYDDFETRFYIETTTSGAIHDSVGYLRSHGRGIPLEGTGGRDLRPFTKKDLVAEMFYNSGLMFRNRGDTEKAIGAYRMALEFNPNHDAAYRAWGDVLSQEGKYESAIDRFEKAASINPNNYAAYTNTGLALNNLKRFEEAKRQFKIASNLNPNCGYTFLNWGIALLCTGEYDAAEKKLLRAQELDESLRPNVQSLLELME